MAKVWYFHGMYIVATHDGKFHTDEIFGVAVLRLHFGSENLNIIRTRDAAMIQAADIVLDVGGEYDPARKRFDHHQIGAPVRENGIPYAAFGLVWKEYGEAVAGSSEIAEKVGVRIAQAIDAGDNGVSLYELNEYKVAPVELYAVLESFMPPMGSQKNVDEAFMQAVEVAENYLLRFIENQVAKEGLKKEAQRVYNLSTEKSRLVFDSPMKRGIFTDYEDVLVIVVPDDTKGSQWMAQTVSVDNDSFASKVLFPESWRGLRDQELIEASGIAGAVFCHKAGFIFVSKTKEGAMQAAGEAR